MKTEEELRTKIASSIAIRDKIKPQLVKVRDDLKSEANISKLSALAIEYTTLATQMSFICGLLGGLYHALGYSNDEIKSLIGDPEYSGLFE